MRIITLTICLRRARRLAVVDDPITGTYSAQPTPKRRCQIEVLLEWKTKDNTVRYALAPASVPPGGGSGRTVTLGGRGTHG
jgi:hypothetical protein